MIKKEMLVVIIVSVILIIIGMFIFNKPKEQSKKDDDKTIVELGSNFNDNIIRATYKNENYLISPYSIEIALNMLKEGANGKTKDELESALGNRKINDLRGDKLLIANAIFIKNKYQKVVMNDYTNILKNNYHAEILYDEFDTPKVINDWVKKNTNDMIPKILDSIDSDFVMGLANALYLDTKWQDKFECENTRREEFTKVDGSMMDASMMHKEYRTSDYRYIKENNLEGIILPYEKDDNTSFEFIALMPSDIKKYVENFKVDEFNTLYDNAKGASHDLRINLSLPRYTYEYSLDDFVSVLNNIGIKNAFDSLDADFSKIIKKGDINGNLYVDEAIHKTKIELNEEGTKAAAVTYFGMKNTAIFEDDYKTIDITFNKPFIYTIRDKNTKEILFFGSVVEPENWQGNTCQVR